MAKSKTRIRDDEIIHVTDEKAKSVQLADKKSR